MEVIPKAITHQIRNGGTFFDAYSKIGMDMMKSKEEKVVEKKREVSDKEKALREKITDQKETNNDNAPANTAKEIWQLTDEEFDEKYGA